MHHGRLDRATAQGLKELRKRIDAANIPPSRLDESINIATWNIREFGKRPRRKQSLHYIAEILNQFDLIAVTEVRRNLTELGLVMGMLGRYWGVVFSDFSGDRAGNKERVAYLYDKRAVTFTGLAAEADPPRVKKRGSGQYMPLITWWRSPYMASFSAGNFDFVLLTAHIRWGGGPRERIAPLQALAEWVDKRRNDKHVVDADWIVMGDFNIPKIGDPLFEAITSRGLRIPKALLGEHGSNLDKSKRYDQILHDCTHPERFTEDAGALDFYAGDHKALYPGVKMDKRQFTFELSDHLPLWIRVETEIDGFGLEQILAKKARPRAH